ncbi:hypothetical protein [Rhodopila sp.]|uniref:hypothetical protein n=1 Tax=Rhodopila sp. TaxID=2480087 RepID=UPI003D0FD32D
MIQEGAFADHIVECAAATLIAAHTAAQDRVFPIRDWPTRQEMFPLLMLQTPGENKASINRGVPTFNTSVALIIEGRVAGTDPEKVGRAVRDLKREVENALLCTSDFVQNVQQFSSIQTVFGVDSDGKQHAGAFRMTLEVEVFQIYEPNLSEPLTDIRGTITDILNGGTLAMFNVNPTT